MRSSRFGAPALSQRSDSVGRLCSAQLNVLCRCATTCKSGLVVFSELLCDYRVWKVLGVVVRLVIGQQRPALPRLQLIPF